MRLKKIKLSGFKSFVDPTTIDFPSQLVGVVGPNGCGKSNVIDAVRWVMGESSAKHLRGASLEDVIFSGSSERKSVGRATVELVFDNRDGGLGGQYASYSEISVRRQLSRDGQSVYFLNGSRCRRRDITDIFLGTGLGPRSYAIIEQGTISRIIEARPEELRVFLEEAAGVSKYKERRRETEARIRDTQENISRLNDLISEIEKRLQTLQRQAKTAERYKALREEARSCKAELLALRWQALDRQVAEKATAIHTLEVRLEEKVAKLRSLEAEGERLRQQQHEAGEQLTSAQSEYYTSGAEVARLEQLIKHHQERLAAWQQDQQEAARQFEEANRDLEGDARMRHDLEAELQRSQPRLASEREAEEAAEKALQAAESAMRDWQQAWDELNAGLARQRQQLEVEATRRQHQQAQLAQYVRRRQRLDEELAALAKRKAETDTRALADDCARLEEQRQSLSVRLEVQQRALEKQRQEARELTAERSRINDFLHGLHREQASLSALQRAALDKQDGAVADWLQELGLDTAPLAELIVVDSGWERAVECVLGRDLEGLATDDLAAAAERSSSLTAGHITLFDARATQSEAAANDDRSPLATLQSKVSAPFDLSGLLAGIFVCESLSEAMAQRQQLPAGASIITRDGAWVGKHWLRLDRGVEEGGVLVREQRLRELQAEIAEAEARLAALDESVAAAEGALGEMGQRREEQQRELHALTRQQTEASAMLARQQATLEQAVARETALLSELEELAQRQHETETLHARADAACQRAQQQLDEQEGQRQALEKRRDQLRDTLDGCRFDFRKSQEQVRDLQTAIETARVRLRALEEAQSRAGIRQQQVEARRQELARLIADAEAPGKKLETDLQEQLQRRAATERVLEEARQAVSVVEHAQRQLADGHRQAEQQQQDVRAELDALRLASQEDIVRRQTVSEQLVEIDRDARTLLATLSEAANEVEWQDRLERIEQRIQRLGPINLAAIDEYEQESERRQYLDAQATDLNEALATLQRAIEKIDGETKARFKETFDQVNERLADLYPRLFGGGMSCLEMTGDDLLDAGVVVVARPPGKRNSSIQQLSGGEKALTAAALVFALFELNPAPFCMLDEVDAPLDDSNAARLCRLVEEMSERVQFIYITHNKIAMEMADQLLGVTMFEPGVSRIVAVDVAEASELAEAG